MKTITNLSRLRIRQQDVAMAFGFSSVKSFRNSSARKRYMEGAEELAGIILERIKKML